jgi:hypothetical protein
VIWPGLRGGGPDPSLPDSHSRLLQPFSTKLVSELATGNALQYRDATHYRYCCRLANNILVLKLNFSDEGQAKLFL